MRTHFKNHLPRHNEIDAKEIWGIDFFWTKGINCTEEDIRKATHKAMYPGERNKDYFRKAS